MQKTPRSRCQDATCAQEKLTIVLVTSECRNTFESTQNPWFCDVVRGRRTVPIARDQNGKASLRGNFGDPTTDLVQAQSGLCRPVRQRDDHTGPTNERSSREMEFKTVLNRPSSSPHIEHRDANPPRPSNPRCGLRPASWLGLTGPAVSQLPSRPLSTFKFHNLKGPTNER